MSKKTVNKNILGYLGVWTAPAGVTSVAVSYGDNFDQLISAGDNSWLALKRNGAVFAAGSNAVGGLGDNTTVSKSLPVAVVGGHFFVQVNAGLSSSAVKPDGSAWTWGFNNAGQLGDNTQINKSSPVPVIGGHSFVQLHSSRAATHMVAVKLNGSAWTWGQGNDGQLGDGTSTIFRASPAPVVGGHSFVQVTSGFAHTAALKADGSAWTWGVNTNGQLGDGTVIKKSSPVAVVGGHSFIQIRTGDNFTAALKADGSVWTWGNNGSGELGFGAAGSSRSSPVPVVGGHSFIQLSSGGQSNIAIKSEGSAWAWGGNSTGNLGDNTRVNKSSPVPVVGGHNFINGSAGFVFSAFLKADGTLWTCGDNAAGQLADNTVVPKSSPVLVSGGNLFEAGAIFINKVILEVVPGTTYDINYFLSQFGSQIVRNYNVRNDLVITLEYYA